MPAYFTYLGLSVEGSSNGMAISPVVWLVLLAVVAWSLMRSTLGASRGRDMDEPTHDISEADKLRDRYARGDIDTATFYRMMAQLRAAENTDDADEADDTADREADPSSEQGKSASKIGTPWSRTPPGVPPGMF